METELKEKLLAYIVQNHPDLLIKLLRNKTVATYLQHRVAEVIPLMKQMIEKGRPKREVEDYCFNLLTNELGPSKYSYLCSVLREEFPREYEKLRADGILVYQLLGILKASHLIFEDFGFNEEAQATPVLRHALIACIHDCL